MSIAVFKSVKGFINLYTWLPNRFGWTIFFHRPYSSLEHGVMWRPVQRPCPVARFKTLPLIRLYNELVYLFEDEMKTQAENEAAIKPAPPLDESIKFNHNITRPEFVADVVTRVYPKDYLISILSQNLTFMGTNHPGFAQNDPAKPISQIKLYYSNIAMAWMQDFDQIGSGIKLCDLKSQALSVTNFKPSLHASIKNFEAMKSKILTCTDIESFCKYIGVYENSKRLATTIISQQHEGSNFSVDMVIKHLANEIKTSSMSNFQGLVEFTEKSQDCMNELSIIGCFEALVDAVCELGKDTGESRAKSLCSFLLGDDQMHRLLPRLDPRRLDNFAHVLAKFGQGIMSFKVLKLVVQTLKVPSSRTMNAFWLAYPASFEDLSKEEAVRLLAIIKPAISQLEPSELSVRVLLKYTVSSSQDLERCIYYIEKSPSRAALLTEVQTLLAETLIRVQTERSRVGRHDRLERVQLFRKLAVEHKIEILPQTLKLLQQ